MNGWRMLACLLALCLGCSMAVSPSQAVNAQPPTRSMVITIDDLPWSTLRNEAPADLMANHQRLLEALRAAQIPLVGFVNEGKLERDGELQAERLAMLEDWIAIGAELGNHTYAHLDLHRVGVEAYQADILRGERHTRPLLAAHQQQPRWFRHPFLRNGQSQADKQAITDFLAAQGYRVAPVTIDNSEWIWAAAYRRLFEQQAEGDQRTALAKRLRDGYVEYMLAKVAYYEQQSRDLFDREIPQVLLLHANRLNADGIGMLLAAIAERGYQFVDLDTALSDPAYQSEDGYFGAYGPSWIHRWAMAAGKDGSFFAGEPRTPQWVLDLAGIDSE